MFHKVMVSSNLVNRKRKKEKRKDVKGPFPSLPRTLLYGNDNLELEENKMIITETLKFIKDTKRFD